MEQQDFEITVRSEDATLLETIRVQHRAVARSDGMEHWIEGGPIRDKHAVQTKIREACYRYYKRILQIL